MACGNTLTPGDARVARSSKTESAQPCPAQALDLTGVCTPAERSLSVGGELVVSETTDVLGVDRDRAEQLNRRATDWTQDRRAALVAVTVEHPDLTAQFIEALGNSERSPEMTARMIDALRIHLNGRSPEPGFATTLGRDRGRRQTALLDDCAKRGASNANGSAYELIMSANVRENRIEGLYVNPGDHVAFGQKAQASIGRMPISGWGSDKGTCEADQLITRPDGSCVAVDFKYRSSGHECALTKKDLNAFAAAIRSGELDEIHFVTNRDFGATTVERVNRLNAELHLAEQDLTREFRFEDLTPEEQDALIRESPPRIVLHANQDWALT